MKKIEEIEEIKQLLIHSDILTEEEWYEIVVWLLQKAENQQQEINNLKYVIKNYGIPLTRKK